MNRNLDGVYFRIKRDNKWRNICFSDLTEDERNKMMKDRSVEWLQSLCNILANKIKEIGDQFDLICE
jgi:hypothetical protein